MKGLLLTIEYLTINSMGGGGGTLFKITVLIFCLISIVSCSGPTSVAEKALKLVGRGTFVQDIAEKYLDIESLNAIKLFTDYGTVFDNSLIYTEEAEHFIKYNFYKKIQQNSFFSPISCFPNIHSLVKSGLIMILKALLTIQQWVCQTRLLIT